MLSGAAVSAGTVAAVADGPVPVGDVAAPESASPGTGDTPESLAVGEARKSGQPVVVQAMTDENTEVTAQPDGSLMATIHANPVRTRKDGKWATIDTSLNTAADGGVAPTAVLSPLEFSGGGTQPLVRISSAGKTLTLTWPKPLPTPVVSGDTAEYRSILPDVDLRMTATDGGFTQLVVVKTAEAAKNPELVRLKIGMSSPDMTMRENADGSLSAVDAAGGGGTVFVAPKPMMFDSSKAAQDGPGSSSIAASAHTLRSSRIAGAEDAPVDDGVHTAQVGLQIADDQKTMTLTPDQSLLGSPTTVYPVMIDPGITTPHAGGWAGISRANPSIAYWKFSYNSTYVPDFGTGYCVAPNCSADDVKRVLYSLPVHGQAFNGKHILSAEFDVKESHSYSCTKEAVQLYATSRISSGTTWNNSNSTSGSSPFWAQNLQTLTDAKGWSSSCPAGNLEFGGDKSNTLRDKVQQAANGNWTDLTLGLKAQDESKADAWKRFTDDATLQVKYNLPPKQPPMKDLSMAPGSVCQLAPVVVNKRPQVTARLSDPDGEKIGVQFAASWNPDGSGFRRRWFSTGALGTPPSANTFKASGSPFSLTLPTSIPINTGYSVGWEARAWDGTEWGPWSSDGDGTAHTDCYFRVDTQAPEGPTVTSPSYPGSMEMADVLPWTDGVGKYGTFSFLSASKDPAHPDQLTYQYAMDAAPSAAQAVSPAAGAPGTVRFVPLTEGPHYLSVKAIDAAGNASSPSTYYFNVMSGQPQRADWNMDDDAGASSLAGGGGTYSATLTGAAASGAAGRTGTALSLPGNLADNGTPADYASTPGAVLDTSDSFTVSAWVSASDISVSRAAVTQDGVYAAGFSLGLYGGKWTFKTATKDAPGATWQSAVSAEPVVAGTWTHLTGVYNRAAGTITVYVNGKPSTSVATAAAPVAPGALQFGRIRWQGTYTDPWKGSLDDVRLWNRALTASDASTVAANTVLTSGVPAKAVWNMNETGSVMAGTTEQSVATVTGAVTTGVRGVSGTAARFGANGFAKTGRPQVDDHRSFSVSVWARLDAPTDTQSKVVVGQKGTYKSDFSLYYSPSYNNWIFGRYVADEASTTLVRAVQPTCTVGKPDVNGNPCIGPTTGEWTHLVGVYDAAVQRIRLFVNGYLVSTVAYTQTSPWPTPGGLLIGADSHDGITDNFFGGDIDDLRVFDRVVTPPEVQVVMQQRPQLVGRWRLNDAASTPLVSPDDLGKHPATLYGPAFISPNANVGTGALSLNGSPASYAATNSVPLHTDESFTVTAWAQLTAPTADMTVLSIGDVSDSALTVRWHYLRTVHDPDFPGMTDLDTVIGEWQVETVTGGTPRKHTVIAHSTDGVQGANWSHLAVTYDAFSNELALYVNGQVENHLCDAEDLECTERTSYAGAEQPLESTVGLQFGRDRAAGAWRGSFSGQIDDVWAYQGVLSEAQIISLAFPAELDSDTGP
ncbi:LamG-like jellyroll fold domain-containing protein [Streptomyces sp. NPDC088910]|uniref:LamG domain-containing protein n=1 Tax=Streptomyces sp. NPDC088910 TaxID=3365911 RepID=UPI003803CC20